MGAFRECKSLESITIPKSVVNVLNIAFEDCTSLTSVTIMGNEKSINLDSSSFIGCSSLKKLICPNMSEQYASRFIDLLEEVPKFEVVAGTKANQVSEERIFAKEDDGGASAGGGGPGGDGGVIAPPSAPGDSSGVVSPDVQPGLDTTEVLGKCDHKKDGFFGPGCFHLPYNIFSVPVYRIPKKKKRKKIPYVNLLEDEGYETFCPYAETRVKVAVDDINRNVLGKIDPELKLEWNPESDFSDGKEEWVASLDLSVQDDANVFPVGVNLPAIYSFLYDKGMENDNLETDLQIRAALLHEAAHAILRYMQDGEIYDMELSEAEEERVCEEFARYHLRKYTGQSTSRLDDTIRNIFKN